MRAHITFAGLAVLTLAATLSASLAGCGGKGTEGTCTTYPACGGTPNGDWSLMTGCSNLVVTPYQQPSLPEQLAQPQTATVAPPQPMPTTSGDWCSQLVYEPSTNPTMAVRSVVLWHGPPTVSQGYVHMNDDHTFAASITFITLEHTNFPSACITRYEHNPNTVLSCDQLGKDLAFYEKTQPGFMFDLAMSCTGDALTTGCDCSYHYQGQSGAMGTWGVDPANTGSIVFSSSVTTEPQSAAFCQNGGTLQLSGENGTDLFGAQGLRSAQFTRM
jgi:hypothetical protein